MTPEEIAEKIVEGIPIGSAVLAHAIAQAIRDAYERAAALIDEESDRHDGTTLDAFDAVAARVRALKGDA